MAGGRFLLTPMYIHVFKLLDPAPTGNVATTFRDNEWRMWSMEEGLEQIIRTLRDHLGADDRIHLYTNKPCTKIEFGDTKTKVS